MPLVLRNEPPGEKGVLRIVEGGIALRHNGTQACGLAVAFTVEELTPLPGSLFCPECEKETPIWDSAIRERIESFLLTLTSTDA